MTTIGLLNEQPLHAALKRWYARPGDVLEAALDGYIVDLLRGNHIVEIQTSSFASIRRKMRTLSQHYRVTLVYPVAYERWILKLPTTTYGQPVRRKSPRRQRLDPRLGEPAVPSRCHLVGLKSTFAACPDHRVLADAKQPCRFPRADELCASDQIWSH